MKAKINFSCIMITWWLFSRNWRTVMRQTWDDG
jgi:hypothetical protein